MPSGRTKEKRRPKPGAFALEELEPRLLLSADLLPWIDPGWLPQPAAGAMPPAGVAAHIEPTEAPPRQAPHPHQPPPERAADAPRRELVVVDPAVPEHQRLVDALRARREPDTALQVVALDPDRDGVRQLTEILERHRGLDAVHVVTHGAEGRLQLGGSDLDGARLAAQAESITRWGGALAEGGDLLLYGCDVAAGAGGRTLVDALAQLTGADVAASTDPTGHAARGGDWELEYAAGTVESEVAVGPELQATWRGLLPVNTVTVNSTTDTADGTTTSISSLESDPGADGVISLREAILAANNTANDAAGPDEIHFDISGSGPHTIQPGAAFANITDAVVIDATTEPDFSNTPVVEIDGQLAGADVDGLFLDTGSSGSTIRGLVINRFSDDAIEIRSDDNRILGNYIGTDVSGTADLGNRDDGIDIHGINNVVGGTTAAERNIVSGNDREGIALDGASGNTILGNYIGTDVTGNNALGNSGAGFRVDGATNNTIGGTGAGEGNIIAHNGLDGVEITGGSSGNAILGNSIHGNAGLGIDLDDDGVTANDAGDGDSGANALQNFPVLNQALVTQSDVTIDGSLNAAANTQYRVEFFASSAADASGHGEGERFLGFADVTTDALGDATFSVTLSASVAAGEIITATATSPGDDTSEFSAAITPRFEPDADAGGPYTVDEGGSVTLDGTGSSDPDGSIATYEWDLDYDGVTFDVDATGATPTFPATGIDGPATRDIALRVTEAQATVESGSGFASTAISNDGLSEAWMARGRNFDSDAAFELGVGTNNPLTWGDTAHHTWNGGETVSESFTLSYDSGTNTASLTVGATTVSFNPASTTFSDLYIQVKAEESGNETGQITVDNLALDLGSGDVLGGLAGSVSATHPGDGTPQDIRFLHIRNLPEYLSDGFTLTGDVSASFSGSIGEERIAFDLLLANDSTFVPGGTALTDTDTTTVTINNVVPSAGDDAGAGFTTDEDSAFVTANVLANDSDPADALAVSALDTTGTLGQVTDNGDGTFSYDPNGQFESLGAGDSATDTFTYTVSDGDGGTDTGIVTITVNGVEDPPTLATNTTLTLDEGATATVTSAHLETTDPDNTPGEITYTLTAVPANGELRLSGTPLGASDSFTQDDIDNGRVTYVHDGSESTSDSFGFDVSDGTTTISAQTFDIAVNAVNDPPANTVPGTQATDENTPVVFSSGNGNAVSIADADTAGNPIEVTLNATDGTVTLSTVSGLTFTSGDGDGDASMTFTATVADANNALDGMSFTPALDFNGTASLEIVTDDQGHSGSGGAQSDTDSVDITVNAQNSAPIHSVPPAQSTPVDTPLVFSSANGNAVSVSDADAGGSDLEVTLTANDGTLALGDAGAVTITGGADGTASVTFTGTIADVNTALEGLTFSPAGSFVGQASVRIQTDDQDHTAPGGAKSDDDTVLVDVTDEAPVAGDDPGGHAAAVQALNPPSFWRLGESSGTTAGDSGSSANDGTFNGVTLGETGALDGDSDTAARFGGDNHVEIPHSDDYLLDNGTVQLWFKADNLNSKQALFSKDHTNLGTGGHLTMWATDNGTVQVRLQDAVSGDNFVESGSVLNAGQWHHVVFTFGARGMELYVDGQLQDTNGYTGGTSATSGGAGNFEPIALGASTVVSDQGTANNLTDFFSGVMDEVALFGGQLSAQEIADLYATGVRDYTVAENGTLTVSAAEGLLVNDVDPQGQGLEVDGAAPVNGSSYGTLTLNADGSFTYQPDPEFNGTDVFTYRAIDDDGNTSNVATVTITVTGDNDAPVNSVPAAQSVNEDNPLIFSGTNGNAITVSDPDAGEGDLEVTLGVTGGTLTLGDAGAVTVTGGADGSSTVRFTGTVTDVNTALDGLTFDPDPDFFGSASLTVTTDDQGNTGTGGAQTDIDSVGIDVQAVNNAPQLSATALDPTFTEGGAAASLYSAAAVDPVESAQRIDQLVLTASNVTDGADERLHIDGSPVNLTDGNTLSTAGGYNVSVALSGATATVTLDTNGAIPAEAETLIDTLAYEHTGDDPTAGARDVTLASLTDDGGTANGGDDTAAPNVTSTVTVAAVNDAPINTVPGTQSSDEDTRLVFSAAGGNAITVSDVDAAGNPVEVTLSAEDGTLSVSRTAGLTFSDGDGSADVTMTLTGRVADINAALEGLAFDPDPDFDGTARVSLSTSDQGYLGSGGPQSDSDALDVVLNPVNDAPVVVVNRGLALQEGGSDVIDDTRLAAGDVDNTPSELTYTLESAPGHGQLELRGNPGVAVSSFTQSQVDAGEVIYVHGDSESTVDELILSLRDGSGGVVGNVRFAISVERISDETFAAVINDTAFPSDTVPAPSQATVNQPAPLGPSGGALDPPGPQAPDALAPHIGRIL